MHLGRMHFRFAPRERQRAMARFNPTDCYTRLCDLASCLHAHPWMVVSGLVEPLRCGRFNRAHSDIDIAVPLADLEAAARAIVAAGFVLTVRVLRTHVSRAYDLEIHLRVEPHALRRHRRHLRLWRIRADGDLDERAFPPYVDVFPYVVADGHMHILDSGQRLELRCPLHSPISLPGGVCVPVEDPSYIDALRESRARSRAAGPDADRRLAPAGARKR
ncbi:MAG TPA: hypothetical protein PLM09_03820 [Casimicrobiaceae bacterium]|nr:hypothetical protein [Casimicrobiaceae bacterium]